MTTHRHLPRTIALTLAFAIAGCGGGQRPAAQLPPPPGATAASEADAIMALLDTGDVKTAQRRIAVALKRDPMDAALQVLRDSIAKDPVQLLGPVNHSYTAKPGETMSGLAERFLGTRLKSYQLSRYNGIEVPSSLVGGQVLKIPGAAPRVDAVRGDPPRRAEPRPTSASAKPKPTPGKAIAAKPPIANPAAARQARAVGLAALNQGNLARAVASLRHAAVLDPANPAISRDLGRAERIAATVRARQ